MPIRPLTNPKQTSPAAVQSAVAAPAPAPTRFGSPAAMPASTIAQTVAEVATVLDRRPLIPVHDPKQPPQQQQFFTPPVSTPAAPAAVAQQGVDIFDIPQDDFDPEAEMAETAIPAPPDDGDHLVQLNFSERVKEGEEIGAFTWKVTTREGTVEKAGVGIQLTAEIVGQNDPHMGRRIFMYANNFSKSAMKADGTHTGGTTNDIALMLGALGVRPTGAPRPDAYRLKELLPATLVVTTQWEAQYPYDAKADEEAKAQGKKTRRKRPFKVGQENFPKDEAGVPQPLYETPTGDVLRTVAVITAFKRATS